MPYTYISNVSERDRFDRLSLLLDDGSTAVIIRGRTYDLSPSERARAQRFVVLVDSASVPDQLVVTARLPIVGDLHDGDVPIWSTSLGAFVPAPISGGGGGTTSGGDARVLAWNATTSAYEPAIWRSDTSVPREFVGPIDPSSVIGISFAIGDRWTPTELPT